MGKVTERRQRRRILAVALLVATVAGTGYAATTAAGKSKAEPVTLTISLFGDFGYHDLYKQYEKAHPGVTIKESIQELPGPPLEPREERRHRTPAPPTSRRSRSASSPSSRLSPRGS